MKLAAYVIVTWVGIFLAYAAAEAPSIMTEVTWGVVSIAMMFAGVLGTRRNYKEDENGN